jgi:hypothetical protein
MQCAMSGDSTHHTIGRLIRQPGLILAIISFLLELVWLAVIQPLDAPDEPGHLLAIMQVRKQHMVPEVHFGPSVHGVVMTRPPADTETRAYVAKLLSKLPVQDQHFLVDTRAFLWRQGRRSNKPTRQALILHVRARAGARSASPEMSFRFWLDLIIAADYNSGDATDFCSLHACAIRTCFGSSAFCYGRVREFQHRRQMAYVGG